MASITLAVTPALFMPSDVAAQQIYRCGNLYSQFPCEGGQPVEAQDKRSPDQKAQIDAATRTTRQTADRMEQSRLQTEKTLAAEQASARRAETARLAALASMQKRAEAEEKTHLLKEKKALAKGLKFRKNRSPVPAPLKAPP